MNYFQAYRYVFDSPKWMQNILLSMVCLFVPMVGPMVLLGYHYEIIEVMHLRGPNQYPDFDMKRLVNYLMRGLWVLLVTLIVSLPFTAVCFIVPFGMGIAQVVMQSQGASPEEIGMVALVVYGIWFPVLMLGSILMNLVLLPLALRAGLSQEFKTAFSWTFVRDFVGKMWWEMILSVVFTMFTAPFVLLAGALLCIFPVYVAAAYVSFLQPHLYYQLYELYLQRGGMAIPLKPEESPV